MLRGSGIAWDLRKVQPYDGTRAWRPSRSCRDETLAR